MITGTARGIGRELARQPAATNATGIRMVIEGLPLKQTGQFIKWNGEPHPW
jgi:short-subunit dehydrogenase involved in D-alanine esterification of teichoic acids